VARRIAAQLLSSYLLIWAPGTFALELFSALPTIEMRGLASWIELGVHGAVAMVCAVAGRMLRIDSPAASTLAVSGILAWAAIAIQSLIWTTLPRDVAPGTRGLFLALACLNAVLWLGVLYWSRDRSRPGGPG
jgi:hypothetical protein